MSPILGIIASQNYPRSTNSYESIATTYLTSGSSSTISFTSIPSTYKHLQLRWLGKDNRGAVADSVNMVFNSNTTTSNYLGERLLGYSGGPLAQATGNSYGTGWISGSTGDNFWGGCIVNITDYANTNKGKAVILKGGTINASAAEVGIYNMWWNQTAAISSITLTPSNGSAFSQWSHFALYGIKG